MYYYFDGKEDLYAYAARTEVESLFTRLGSFPVPSDDDADAFWATLADYYLRLMTALNASPQLAAFIRSRIAASRKPALQQAQQDMVQTALPWIEQTLAAGQRIQAVRSDLPSTLLIAVVIGMGQAMDTWLLTHQPDANQLPRLVGALDEMIQGAVKP